MTDQTRECEYVYHGPNGDKQECSLTGHACLCCEDWHHCTVREYAIECQAKRTTTPRQFEGIILKDGKGHIQDMI
jgi:hypothetical protein